MQKALTKMNVQLANVISDISRPARTLESPAPSITAAETVVQKRKKARKPRDNEPRMDLRAELKRICGVDLTSIDGVNVITAFTVISEVGTDMSRFEEPATVICVGSYPRPRLPSKPWHAISPC